MRNLAGVLSLGFALIIGVAHAQFGPSIYVGSSGAPASFTGVGDALSGAVFHSGVIAYSAAQRGQPLLNLCNGGVCANVNSDATTGIVPNAPTINGAPCDNSGHICTGTIIDDSGALACAGGTKCSMTTGTAFTFVPSAIGSIPGLKCNGSSTSLTSSTITSAHAQPISSGASYSIPSIPAANNTITATGTGNILQGINNAAKPYTYAGTLLNETGAIATSTFVATLSSQDGANNASLSTNNGAATTGAVGSNSNGAGTAQIFFCNDAFSNFFNGTILEFFWYPAQFSSGNVTAMVGKMRTNGGGF